jgi:threonine synthase
MNPFLGYRCSVCGKEYGPDEASYDCPRDQGVLDVRLDYDAIKKTTSPRTIAQNPDPALWRYEALLPVARPGGAGRGPSASELGPLGIVGGTPLFLAPRAAKRLGLRELWIKDDGRLPTGSLKDRASSIVTARALELGVERIVAASTGNAGVAQAAMANAAGISAAVIVPATAPRAKIAQLMIFGAELLLVEGNYDAAFALALAASRELGWYCRNTGYNPFTAEGKKTVSFEICEQLSRALTPSDGGDRWIAPDRIVVSVGDGNIIAGVHKGLKDLLALGWIDRMPKLVGVQAEGSAAVANAFAAGTETIAPVAASTLADSISADRPADGLRALRAARDTGGTMVTVSDQQILDAIVALGRDATVFAEPAASAAYAGLCSLVASGGLDPAERIVVLITGNGLKDVSAASRAAAEPKRIQPSVKALREALGI